MNGTWSRNLAALALMLMAVGVQLPPALADAADHEQARQALAAGEVLSLRQILDRVEKRHPGQVLEVELEREQGRWIYEIKLLRPEGAVSKLKLDARNGDLLQQKTREKP